MLNTEQKYTCLQESIYAFNDSNPIIEDLPSISSKKMKGKNSSFSKRRAKFRSRNKSILYKSRLGSINSSFAQMTIQRNNQALATALQSSKQETKLLQDNVLYMQSKNHELMIKLNAYVMDKYKFDNILNLWEQFKIVNQHMRELKSYYDVSLIELTNKINNMDREINEFNTKINIALLTNTSFSAHSPSIPNGSIRNNENSIHENSIQNQHSKNLPISDNSQLRLEPSAPVDEFDLAYNNNEINPIEVNKVINKNVQISPNNLLLCQKEKLVIPKPSSKVPTQNMAKTFNLVNRPLSNSIPNNGLPENRNLVDTFAVLMKENKKRRYSIIIDPKQEKKSLLNNDTYVVPPLINSQNYNAICSLPNDPIFPLNKNNDHISQDINQTGKHKNVSNAYVYSTQEANIEPIQDFIPMDDNGIDKSTKPMLKKIGKATSVTKTAKVSKFEDIKAVNVLPKKRGPKIGSKHAKSKVDNKNDKKCNPTRHESHQIKVDQTAEMSLTNLEDLSFGGKSPPVPAVLNKMLLKHRISYRQARKYEARGVGTKNLKNKEEKVNTKTTPLLLKDHYPINASDTDLPSLGHGINLEKHADHIGDSNDVTINMRKNNQLLSPTLVSPHKPSSLTNPLGHVTTISKNDVDKLPITDTTLNINSEGPKQDQLETFKQDQPPVHVNKTGTKLDAIFTKLMKSVNSNCASVTDSKGPQNEPISQQTPSVIIKHSSADVAHHEINDKVAKPQDAHVNIKRRKKYKCRDAPVLESPIRKEKRIVAKVSYMEPLLNKKMRREPGAITAHPREKRKYIKKFVQVDAHLMDKKEEPAMPFHDIAPSRPIFNYQSDRSWTENIQEIYLD
ncbi:uncharacterized protein LOC135927113 [Gordionus sp. m RMFG-2023]|uniref:uncharacterized protein LOC135927113 n=1 Tax=Gordionus sp. m RMFG-2023 TaxID=3053472 RepID=UPI0031FC5DC0